MCRSEYRGGFRRGLLMSHGTDSVRTNLAGSVGVKTAIWEFKYNFCSVLSRQESRALTPPQRPTPQTGREFPKNDNHCVVPRYWDTFPTICVLCGF